MWKDIINNAPPIPPVEWRAIIDAAGPVPSPAADLAAIGRLHAAQDTRTQAQREGEIFRQLAERARHDEQQPRNLTRNF